MKNISDVVYTTETVNPSFETQLGKTFLDRAQSQLVRFTAREKSYLYDAPALRVVYVGASCSWLYRQGNGSPSRL